MPNFATVSSIVHVILGKKIKGWCTENKETNSVKLKKASWHWPNWNLVNVDDIVYFFDDVFLIHRFKELAAKSKDDLVALGFPQFTIEDFHDTVSNL